MTTYALQRLHIHKPSRGDTAHVSWWLERMGCDALLTHRNCRAITLWMIGSRTARRFTIGSPGLVVTFLMDAARWQDVQREQALAEEQTLRDARTQRKQRKRKQRGSETRTQRGKGFTCVRPVPRAPRITPDLRMHMRISGSKV